MNPKFLIPTLMIGLISLSTSLQSCKGEKKTDKPESKIIKKGDTTLPTSAEELKALQINEGDFKYGVEDFFKNPEKVRYQLSPDGEYLAYMSPYESRQNLFVQKIGEEDGNRITSETDRDIQGFFWANNNRIVYIQDNGGDEDFHLYGVDKDGANSKKLTPYEGVKIQIIDDLEHLEEEVIIGMNKNNPMLFEPYRLNINTGEVEQIASNENAMEPIVSWMTDHDGKLRMFARVVNGVETQIHYRDNEDEDFRKVFESDFKTSVEPQFFDFNEPHIVWALSNIGRDKEALVKFDMREGKEVEKIFEHPDVDLGGVSFSRLEKKPLTVNYTTEKRQIHFLDADYEAMYKSLKSQLPGYEVVLTSSNKAEDKFLIRTYSDKSLGAYYFFDKNSKELKKINNVSDWIDEKDMADMKPVTYSARDGLKINGYLTLPKGAEAKNLPFVINVHGGPWARDNWGFNPEVQLLASRGYGVLQMNFRGSTGYGKKFWMASFKEWGQKMQDDVSDGVQWLIDQGYANPDRVAIYGASYGGYATLAGMTFTPDLYACGIDYVGVSSLFTFMESIPPYWEPLKKMMYEMVGDPNTADSTMMRKASPALNVEKIEAPLLVVQGANDPRVKIAESDQMVKAMRENGVEVPYLVKYNEGHGFQNEENRFEFYRLMLGFLEKHL